MSPDKAKELLGDHDEARRARIARKTKEGKPLSVAEVAFLQSIATGAKAGPAALGARPYLTRKSEIAELLGISRQLLNYHAARPDFPPPDSAGRYKTAAILQWAKAAGIAGPGPAGAGVPEPFDAQEILDLQLEQGRLVRSKRIAQDMANAQKAGALVEVEAVESAWDAIVMGIRQRLLGVPSKVESQINLPPGDRAAIRAILDREVEELLGELTTPPNYAIPDEEIEEPADPD